MEGGGRWGGLTSLLCGPQLLPRDWAGATATGPEDCRSAGRTVQQPADPLPQLCHQMQGSLGNLGPRARQP